jgi:hypothetical protein
MMQPRSAANQFLTSSRAVKPATGNQSLTSELSNRDNGIPQKEIAAPAATGRGDENHQEVAKLQGENYPTAASDATANSAAAWLRRDLIAECGDLISSLGVSLAEAAYRGSDATCEATLRQIIATTRTACQTFRELAPASIEGGAQ